MDYHRMLIDRYPYSLYATCIVVLLDLIHTPDAVPYQTG